MIDYGARRIERPRYDLLATKLRPGDIYTHVLLRPARRAGSETGKASKALLIGRQRGIYFDGGPWRWVLFVDGRHSCHAGWISA